MIRRVIPTFLTDLEIGITLQRSWPFLGVADITQNKEHIVRPQHVGFILFGADVINRQVNTTHADRYQTIFSILG